MYGSVPIRRNANPNPNFDESGRHHMYILSIDGQRAIPQIYKYNLLGEEIITS